MNKQHASCLPDIIVTGSQSALHWYQPITTENMQMLYTVYEQNTQGG